MMSRLMINLHETADVGLYSTTRSLALSTDLECRSPTATTDVELDTLRSGDFSHGVITSLVHHGGFKESNQLISTLRT